MEKTRAYRETCGEIVAVAQIDAWFKEHAGPIRRVRDKLFDLS